MTFPDVNLTLKEGFVVAVMKKPKKTVVGIYSSLEKAEDAIKELGGSKYFRKQKFLMDTQIDRRKVTENEDIMTQRLIINKSVYNSPESE